MEPVAGLRRLHAPTVGGSGRTVILRRRRSSTRRLCPPGSQDRLPRTRARGRAGVLRRHNRALSSALAATAVVSAVSVLAWPVASRAADAATSCTAQTFNEPSTGRATFTGRCRDGSTFLVAGTGSVLGRVGGLRVSFVGGSTFLAGRIGSWRTSYTSVGQQVFGRYGQYRLSFSFLSGSLVGRIGGARVSCRWFAASSSASFTCTGRNGGAEAMIPFLAHWWASPS